MTATQGFCRVEEPVEDFLEFLNRASTACGEISLGVFDGATECIDVVVESIEFVACDDQLVLTQFQVARPLTGHPVPLPASLAAEHLRTTRAGARRQNPSTPTTVANSPVALIARSGPGHQFRHDKKDTRPCEIGGFFGQLV